jgi:dTDP-4-dehydrorhamnose 3,5-epimerase
MNARFDVIDTPIGDLKLLQRKTVGDSRGYFERMYCSHDLAEALGGRTIAQINHTLNHRSGTVRGMHFQYPPYAECKIVSCLHGAIFDVAVDLRPNSPTFLQWHGEIISSENHRTLVIPEGFAHGFQALSDDSELLYLSTSPYHPGSEGAINPEDHRIGIQWPVVIAVMSDKDRDTLFLSADFEGVVL